LLNHRDISAETISQNKQMGIRYYRADYRNDIVLDQKMRQ